MSFLIQFDTAGISRGLILTKALCESDYDYSDSSVGLRLSVKDRHVVL